MILSGDLFDVLPTLAEASFDACVTDPPYGIGFMGREWDTFKPGTGKHRKLMHPRERIASKNPNIDGRHRSPALSPSQIDYDYTVKGLRAFQDWTERWAAEVFRVLKPGAYIVVCGAPRSYHRMACGLEDAGFVVRDQFAWLFGSGFPKNKNLGDGKGTALKPAHEPIALAWKPFKGSLTACHQQHGTAALNIDACRLGSDQQLFDKYASVQNAPARQNTIYGTDTRSRAGSEPNEFGRWPANVLLDEEAAAALDEMTGELTTSQPGTSSSVPKFSGAVYNQSATPQKEWGFGDIGGASRFYYVAKPSREERDLGCYDLATRQRDESRKDGNPGGDNPRNRGLQPRGNFHPTVKPLALMRWLVRLVTPPGGRVLDPFGGSGTTAMACAAEGINFTLIEREAEYIPIIEARVRAIAPLFTEIPA